MKFSISLYLDRFLKSEIIMHNVEGKEMKGVFIPFEPNNVRTLKSGNVVYLYCNEIGHPLSDTTHFIGYFTTKTMSERIKKMGLRKMPILGYLAPQKYKKRLGGLVGDSHFDNILSGTNEKTSGHEG